MTQERSACAELRANIESMQREVDQIEVAIRSGSGDEQLHRTLSEELANLQRRYSDDCGDVADS